MSADGFSWERPAGDNRLIEPRPGFLIESPFLLQQPGEDRLYVSIKPHAVGAHTIYLARGRLTVSCPPGPAFPFTEELDNTACSFDSDYPNRSACVESPDGCGAFCYLPRNRYLSFDTNQTANQGQEIAFRIELLSSAYFPTPTGQVGWVGQPDANRVAHVADVPWVSNLDGSDWPNTVHVAGCPIVPVATYSIVATNLFDDPTPLDLPTIFKRGVQFWGDCVGFFDGTRWMPSQGITNIDDAVAAIKTFQNNGSTTHLSRVDVEGEQVNHVININDVFMIVKGLRGEPYPFADPQDCLP